MITCVSSNMNTQKSAGKNTNQDEREQPNAYKDSTTNVISAAHNLKYDNKTESNPPNENLLSEKNKFKFTSNVSGYHSSVKSYLTNEKDVSLFSNQDSRKDFSKPIANTVQGSGYELPTDQQQSDAEEDGSEPILDSESDIGTFRSNSFRDIKSMVPRGYGKMDKAELTKTHSKASIDLGHFNNSQNNNENNADYGTDISEKNSHMLEEMQRRHAATWKLLGYDPTHGKGDMRGSATLANFSPLKLIRQSKLFAQNGCSEENLSNNNSSVKQVVQSYSLCIKPSYRTLKRVNSSNGPLSNLIDENCGDQDEDENQAQNSPFNQNNKQSQKKDDDDDYIPPNDMTIESLLNGPDFFKDDDSEEYLVVEEEEEEEFEEEEFEEEEENEIENKNATDIQNEENLKQSVEQKSDENSTDLEKQTKK